MGDLKASDQTFDLANTVSGNSVGIMLGAADAVLMRDNSATGNSGYGLDVSSTANDYTITYNDLRLNRYRLASSDGVFRDNQL